MITVSKSDFEKIVEEARTRFPEEACGLIAGVKDGDDAEIRKVYLLENIDHSREHFTMDPKDQLAAIKDMRKEGLTPLGNWHSHPETPARPSDEDKRLAFDKNAIYCILSLQEEEHPVLHAFHIEGTDSTRLYLEIID